MACCAPSSSDDENDPVVLEAPVYLSKLLDKKLHIFQYPVRPAAMAHETPVIRSRIKPRLKEVELEVGLDPNSPNFDHQKAAEVASRVDGDDEDGGENKTKVYESGIMDKQILVSGPYSIDTPLNYAIGKFHNGALHLCPVKAILQLQPSLIHGEIPVTEADKPSEEKVSAEVETPPQKVSVKFQRHESERAKKLKKMSYSYYRKKRAEEKWIETHYYPATSHESELERRKVICDNPRLEVSGLNVNKNQYLKRLVPYKPAKRLPLPCSSMMVSVASLKPLHWLEKLRTLLLSAKIMQFEKLVSLLADERKPKDIHCLLRALQTLAVMVRGNWIVRSEVLYPESTNSRHNGVPSMVICRARDYLLSLFNQYKYVGRVKFVNFVKIPREEAKEMLMDIAQYHENKGWDLLYPNDCDFMRRYPEITMHQQMILEERRNVLDVLFKEMHEPKSPEVPRRQRKKSGREISNESGSDVSASPRRRKKHQ